MFFYTRRKRGNEEDEISEKVDGFWKILEADLPVKRKKKDGQIINVGFKNRLEFSGNQRTQTQWRMNEFRLHQKEEESRITEVDRYANSLIYARACVIIFSHNNYFFFLIFYFAGGSVGGLQDIHVQVEG